MRARKRCDERWVEKSLNAPSAQEILPALIGLGRPEAAPTDRDKICRKQPLICEKAVVGDASSSPVPPEAFGMPCPKARYCWGAFGDIAPLHWELSFDSLFFRHCSASLPF